MFLTKVFVTLVAVAFCSCVSPRQLYGSGKIVGGEDAEIEEVPYQAAIFYDNKMTCGGSILSQDVVVSAAQCYDLDGYMELYSIRIGTNMYDDPSSQNVSVSRIVRHEDYDYWMADYDVAIFFTSTPLILDGVTARAIGLPIQGQVVPDGSLSIISGWGMTDEFGVDHSIVLQKATVPIVNQSTCNDNHSTGGEDWVTDQMICAGFDEGGKDACIGDAGGPLVINSELIGISSWGRGCGLAELPGVWTRVPSVSDWIKNQMLGNQTTENVLID